MSYFNSLHFDTFDEFMAPIKHKEWDQNLISMMREDNDSPDAVKIDSETTNIKFILSFGGGAYDAVSTSFPDVLSHKLIDNEGDKSTEGVVIIAFDPTFSRKDVRDSYVRRINGLIPKDPRDDEMLKYMVNVYTISSAIPTCDYEDLFSVRAIYELQQAGQTFSYYKDKTCPVPENEKNASWIKNFIELLSFINKRNFEIFIHHDAWHNVSGISGPAAVQEKLSFGRFLLGVNFEVLPIIPHLLINHFNNDNLFMIRDPNIYPFLDRHSVLWWNHPKIKDPERLKFIRNYVAEAAAPEAAAPAPEAAEQAPAAAAPAPAACGGAGCAPLPSAAASPRRGGSRRLKRRKSRKTIHRKRR